MKTLKQLNAELQTITRNWKKAPKSEHNMYAIKYAAKMDEYTTVVEAQNKPTKPDAKVTKKSVVKKANELLPDFCKEFNIEVPKRRAKNHFFATRVNEINTKTEVGRKRLLKINLLLENLTKDNFEDFARELRASIKDRKCPTYKVMSGFLAEQPKKQRRTKTATSSNTVAMTA